MSKEKTLRTLEETEVMQTAGIPTQETEGANVVLATEIIADLKKQLEEAKEEADNLEKDWEFCSQQRLILTMQTDIINFALKIFDYKCLSMALSYVKAAYNQQPPEEVQDNKDRRSLQHTYELAELFRVACSSNEAFMELSEEDQERFWLITDALMMNDPEDLKRVHNLANYLMVKRIKDNAKVAEA